MFGNSNSLPISLVISLSQTIKGLHWDKIPGDNDDEVAARGILYLLIFQQLGQLVRWSWGYHVLLAPPDKFRAEDAYRNSQVEQGFDPYSDMTDNEQERLINDTPSGAVTKGRRFDRHATRDIGPDEDGPRGRSASPNTDEDGETTPVTHQQYTSSLSSQSSQTSSRRHRISEPDDLHALLPTPANGTIAPSMPSNHITSFPRIKSADLGSDESSAAGAKGFMVRCRRTVLAYSQSAISSVRNGGRSLYRSLPHPLQAFLRGAASALWKFCKGVWDFMNPPLWAMLAAIIVASVPSLQRLFFREGTFVQNSITSAIRQMGGVAVPLILVVLGANLEGKTQPRDPHHSDQDDKEETKLLIASLISRMLFPIIIMAPLLALAAKYIPVSILDDPIFVIVCFLLTGAPSALQLAQICQINGVYLGAMSRLLFQSYVVWSVSAFPPFRLCLTDVGFCLRLLFSSSVR